MLRSFNCFLFSFGVDLLISLKFTNWQYAKGFCINLHWVEKGGFYNKNYNRNVTNNNKKKFSNGGQ